MLGQIRNVVEGSLKTNDTWSDRFAEGLFKNIFNGGGFFPVMEPTIANGRLQGTTAAEEAVMAFASWPLYGTALQPTLSRIDS